MDHSNELDELLDATLPGNLDPIFLRIGREDGPDLTDPSEFNLGPGDVSIAVTFGRMWWNERRPQVENLICGNELIDQLEMLDKLLETERSSELFESPG